MSLTGTQQGWSAADNYANNTYTRNNAVHSGGGGTTNNHNHGGGIFNNVLGTQNNTYVTLGLIGGPLARTGIDLDIQPYKSIIHSLADIEQRLQAFTQSPSVAARRKQVDDFRRMVACVGKAMEIIHHDYPQLARHPFFHTIDAQALDYGRSLEQLKEDISRYRDKLFAAMEHGLQYAADEWIRSLSPQLKHLISNNHSSLTRFLHVLLKPEYRRILGDKHGALREVMSRLGLSPTMERHVEVHTIWIQDPTGESIHAIPLSLCTSLRDLGVIFLHYFGDGPASEYIIGGNWEMVRLDDNHVITENRFLDAMKPGAIFDVGVIMTPYLAHSQHTCPQCGKEYTTTDTWIRCEACGTMFRKIDLSIPEDDVSVLQPGYVASVLQPGSGDVTNFRRVSYIRYYVVFTLTVGVTHPILGDVYVEPISRSHIGGTSNVNNSVSYLAPCWVSFGSFDLVPSSPSQVYPTPTRTTRVTGRSGPLGTAASIASQAILKWFHSSCTPSESVRHTDKRLRGRWNTHILRAP